MHVLRLLRIFIPLLLVAAIVAAVVVVLTSRNELQSSRRAVEDTWTPLRTGLDQRYAKLAVANNAVDTIPGPLHVDLDESDVGVPGMAACRAGQERRPAGDRGQQPRVARAPAGARGPGRAPPEGPDGRPRRDDRVRRARRRPPPRTRTTTRSRTSSVSAPARPRAWRRASWATTRSPPTSAAGAERALRSVERARGSPRSDGRIPVVVAPGRYRLRHAPRHRNRPRLRARRGHRRRGRRCPARALPPRPSTRPRPSTGSRRSPSRWPASPTSSATPTRRRCSGCSRPTRRCSSRSACAPGSELDGKKSLIDQQLVTMTGELDKVTALVAEARRRPAQGLRRAQQRARGASTRASPHCPSTPSSCARCWRAPRRAVSGASAWPRTCCGSPGCSKASTTASRPRSTVPAVPTTRSCCPTAA